MVRFRFGQYIFHTHGLRLERAGQKVSIRPKTALLLSVLIANRDRTVSKQELFQLVWNTDHVQDHALFQLISEIRKLAPESELIRTQPNVGYQWVVKTEVCTYRKAHFALATAASLACLYAGLSLFNSTAIDVNSNTQSDLQSFLPAMSAYSKGAIAFEKGEMEKAEKWLRFSLAENPDSIDTKLLLAESLLQQNKLAASESLAQSVMQAPENFTYNASAAADLLSRIYQQQGSVYNALEYAIRGSEELDTKQAICTAQVFDHRIKVLSELLGQQSELAASSSRTNTPGSDFGGGLISSVGLTAKMPENSNSDRVHQCARLKKSLPDDELSKCFELEPAWNSTPKFVAKENLYYISRYA